MSAIDDLLNLWKDDQDADLINDARAELVALRDSLSAWSTLWTHICKRMGGIGAEANILPNESNFDYLLESASLMTDPKMLIQLRSDLVNITAERDAFRAQLATYQRREALRQ